MYKIRIYGRGGQGGKTLARMIAKASFYGGLYAQDFSIYGAERRGAPVTSFVRVDNKPIRDRGYIDYPDLIVIMDDTLFKVMDPLKDAESNTQVLVNTGKEFDVKTKARLFRVNATKIALETIKRPVYNTPLLGAVAKLTRLFTTKTGEKVIREELSELPQKKIEENVSAMKICFEKVHG